ncbi:MAG: TonB-dependent receptor [Muribaculaceae bacterium]|nr:TonB-dependent receptor [Muribaculaceae bacterium]
MRRLKIISLSALLAVSVTANAQKVSINAHDKPAEKVFAELMDQSGKNFIYQAGLLKSLNVTVSADKEPLDRVLDRMLAGTGISYRMRGNNVLLFRKETPKPSKATLSGFVREDGTGEAIPGVTVSIYPTGARTATNVQGFYSLTVPTGDITVSFTGAGYENYRTDEIKLTTSQKLDVKLEESATMLEGVTVIGNLNSDRAVNSAEIGSMNVSRSSILTTPVIFGESDLVKTLQLEPGVSSGVEGMAGMYVHGGGSDENLYMLDNIPLYQVNHFGGLFSAFNTEALRNVDFYKSSFPAKYDGRLSSYIDVNTKDGNMEEHHGSVKIGLTSAAVNVDGPIWKGRTSYSFAARRSWYDVLSLPASAIASSFIEDGKLLFGYAFTDINAKINHRFSDRSRAYAMFYYGEDYLHLKQDDYYSYWRETQKSNLRWGNIVASAGWNYVLTPNLFGEITGAFTRYASHLTHSEETDLSNDGEYILQTFDKVSSRNYIHDWILKCDFDWRPHPAHRISFGGGYTRHSFLPSLTKRYIKNGDISASIQDRVHSYGANEMNLYAGADWTPFQQLRINYGLHYSIFNIDGKTHDALSPRVSFRFHTGGNWAIKGGYSRTVQYVHQLMQSSISLPTDQWVPIVGEQKPQTADKIAIGGYYTYKNQYTFSAEAYYKWMDNLLEYADEYYLLPPDTEWSGKLTAGKGTAKGIDFKLSKDYGKVSGHIAYSLLWADRQYPDKNGGRKFPARFDNRHKINVLLNWKISPKWELSASWTGMSGNRITLPTQMWQDPLVGPWHYDMTLPTEENNFRLPFYHRMDLNLRRNTRHGYWNFSLYNAYCNLNTIAVIRDYSDSKYYYNENGNLIYPNVFKKLRLIPIIPSVSYTWLF